MTENEKVVVACLAALLAWVVGIVSGVCVGYMRWGKFAESWEIAYTELLNALPKTPENGAAILALVELIKRRMTCRS